MEKRDEYANYTHIFCLNTIEVDGKELWLKGKAYKIIEIFKNDRILLAKSEDKDNKMFLSLDDEDLRFVESYEPEGDWHKGYKEVKNVIHNEIGVNKEEILEVFRQVAKDEIGKLVSDNRAFIYNTLKDVIKHEMYNAVEDHRYPQVSGHMRVYGRYGGENAFKDYIAGIMKEEIMNKLEDTFNLSINIEKNKE